MGLALLLCFLVGAYAAIGLLIPTLPLIRTRFRAFIICATATVGMLFALLGLGASISPEERKQLAERRAAAAREEMARKAEREKERLRQTPGYISREDLGEEWPLIVDDGVLICDQSRRAIGAVLFETGGHRYAVNGTAKGLLDYPRIEVIWKVDTTSLTPFTKVARIREADRKRLFAELVECQDQGTAPPHDQECRTASKRKHRITESELNQISVEGMALSWPPLSPRRMNIGPLIERGLALCRR